MDARRLPAGAGLAWFACGWQLFRLAPLNWLLLSGALVAVNVLLALVPLVGPVLLLVITPALYGGVALAAREQIGGSRPQLGHLVAALSEPQRRAPMLRLGVLLLAVYMLALLVGSFVLGTVAGVMGIELLQAEPQEPTRLENFTEQALIMVLAMLAIVDVIIAGVFFFAVPLVMFRGLAPAAALQAGIGAAFANLGALFVFLLVNAGLGALVLAGALTLPPLAAALVVVAAVGLAAWCCAYRSVFEDAATPSVLAA